jgi:hypothetical protein
MLVLAVKSLVLKLLRRADSLLAYNTTLCTYFATKIQYKCYAARTSMSAVYKICSTASEDNNCSGIGLVRYIANKQ